MTDRRASTCTSSLNCWQECARSCHLYKVLLILLFRWLSAAQVLAWDSVTVRLSGGSAPWEGLVEVFYEGIWGSVCDDFWDENDGRVVCRQLGYKSVVKVTTSLSSDKSFGTSSRPIILDNVRCDGNEENLGQCTGNYGILAHDCTQIESAGVICQGQRSTVQGSVRLADAGASWRGNVEVFYGGEWGTVCDNSFDINAGDVVCRQLGFPGARNVYDGSKFGWGAGNTLLFDVSCIGTESRLLDCHGTWGAYSSLCYKTENAGVACIAESGAPNISLAGGAYPNQGLVQIFLNEQWGTVCDNNWDIEEASVVCRQLGYETAVEAVISSGFGSGQGNILLEDIRCYGEEISIYFCDHNGVGTTDSYDCGFYGEDNTAGVVCKSDDYPNHVVLPSSGDSGLRDVIPAVIGITVPIIILIFLCWCCRSVCRNDNKRSNATTVTVQPAQGNLYTPVPTAPPSTGHPSALPSAVYPPSAGPPTAPYPPSAGPPSAPYPAPAGPPSSYPASSGPPTAPYPASAGPLSASYPPSAGPPSAPYPPSAPAYPPSAVTHPDASYPTGVIPPPVASGYEPPSSYPQAAQQPATAPSAPDLPPQYDSVMADPSKYGLQSEPPPPTYTQSAVVFNPATQSVDVETSYSTTA